MRFCAPAQDLLEALGRVPDPRDPRGRRYPLVPVLAIAVWAMLAGARSYAAIAERAADAPPRLRARLGLRTGTGPHVMAALRSLVISILRMAGHVSIAAALRHTARDPLSAFRLLTGRK
jgi:DDE_Tnp_1-associated